MDYNTIFKCGNVSIIKGDDGKFGMIDSSNSIVAAMKYDSIQPLTNDTTNRYLKVTENGLIGIYDTKKVDFIQYCTLSKIIKIQNGVVYGKKPYKLWGIKLFSWSVEIPLDGYICKKKKD